MTDQFPKSTLLNIARLIANNRDRVIDSMSDSIYFFVYLAGVGYAQEALDILVGSPGEEFLEPLVVGLKLQLGEKAETMKVPIEVLEVGRDVQKRIEDWQKELGAV